MTQTDKSKRTFFKKVAAVAGFVSVSGYTSKLISRRNNPIDRINENNTSDMNRQKKAWLQKQWVPMTDRDKKQMLDEILEIHNKHQA